jgi:putative transposase
VVIMQVRYRYRIEPTEGQAAMLARTFGCARVVFNDAIRAREEAYQAGEWLSDTEVQRRVITTAKTTDARAWLAEVASVALVQSVQDARRAWRNYFDSLAKRRKGRRVGRPRFKSRKDNRQSVRFTRNGFALRPDGRLFLAKIGELRVRWSRDLPSVPSSVTIIREPDEHYYASFVVERQTEPLPETDRETGVDLGIARFATCAGTDGTRTDVPNRRHQARKERKLARVQREKARQQKGSNNRAKTRRKEAVQHGKVARARRDEHHKQALDLVRENQAVYVEDLGIAGMVANHRLARAISDAGWAQFVRILEEKAEHHGRAVVKVDRCFPSSKTCSACGAVQGQMPLQVRTWTCGCGATHDRDFNAACNILAAGRAERRNACGAPVSPPSEVAVRDEAGSRGKPRGTTTRIAA